MENQFTDLTPPDLNQRYFCNDISSCKGFTNLMKLVLLVRKFPYAIDMIKKILIESPEEIDKKNQFGLTALMLASKYSNCYSNNQVIKMLIDYKADVNLLNNCGYTALMLASIQSSTDSNNETVKILIEANSNINLQNKSGFTALMLASEYSNTTSSNETVKLLIESGANVDLQINDGHTALIISVSNLFFHSNVDTVRILIDFNANVNLMAGGLTALMIAIYNRYSDNIIKLLIDSNNDFNLKSEYGQTALTQYILNSSIDSINKELLEILIVKSSKTITDTDLENKTAYDHYTSKEYDILDEYYLRLLRGVISVANTKSARFRH